jgi:mRNA-degrading endonuclease RelE of RelBE toxin-antitoxin system
MKFVWPESVRAELRGIDRESAMRVLIALTHYGESGVGDIKALAGEWDGYFRLRTGDFRVIFQITADAIVIVRVRHRSDVYR